MTTTEGGVTAAEVDRWLAEHDQIRVTREVAREMELAMNRLTAQARARMVRLHPFPGNQLRKVNFTEGDYDGPGPEPVTDLAEANVVTSEFLGHANGEPIELPWLEGPKVEMHRPVIDIDRKAKLLPSTFPGHHHLYLGVPMPRRDLWRLLDVMADVGIVEPGYVAASKARGYTAVRLPWVRKSGGLGARGYAVA